MAGAGEELVDAAAGGQAVGHPALGPAPRRHRIGGGRQILHVGDSQWSQSLQDGVQDIDGGPCVVQGAVSRSCGRAHERCQGPQPVVGHLRTAPGLARQGEGVHDARFLPWQCQLLGGAAQVADVEARVVRHQDRPRTGPVRPFEEGRQGLVDRRGIDHHGVRDPCQDGDLCGDGGAGVDQGGELAVDDAAAHAHGADLGDCVGARCATGGLQIDRDEGHLSQGCAHIVEGRLHSCGRIAGRQTRRT